jgi:hypothetical protein
MPSGSFHIQNARLDCRRVAWDAVAGEHELLCRATDETGRVQPLVAPQNAGGYVNNSVQRVLVVVA